MENERFAMNRGTFLGGSLAAMSLALPQGAQSAEPAGPSVAPEDALARLKAGNARFVANDFPVANKVAEKREMLKDGQSPFAAILSCADSRVIPEAIFVQGLGQLFVTRVAGNYPDNLVTGSLEYAVEHLGTRLIVVLGHQNCGAVKAVYEAITSNAPLPVHLNAIEALIGPGVRSIVNARGTIREAIEANVRAATASLRATGPVIAEGVRAGHLRVAGGVYQLGSGKVSLID